MRNPPVYLDNHATTRVDRRVVERLLPFFETDYGNAASRHHVFGWKAEAAVEAARTQVAQLVGATAREVVFTSGATEANNLALFGVAEAYRERGRHLITQATEHSSVLDPCRVLAQRGADVTVLPVDAAGRVSVERLAEAVRPDTVLVSLMLANNEVGTLQDVAAAGELCRAKGVLLHCDATQAAGTVPVRVEELGVSLLSLSAHKLYGPKGVGALYVRRRDPRAQLSPLVYGGGHERGLRSGTPNVPGIVGFGEAARLALAERDADAERIRRLRDLLQARLCAALPSMLVLGHPTERLAGNLNVTLPGVSAEDVMLGLPDVALSSGAACASASREPSHVLAAMGLSAVAAHGSLRFGLGRFTTEEEVSYVAGRVVEVLEPLVARARQEGLLPETSRP